MKGSDVLYVVAESTGAFQPVEAVLFEKKIRQDEGGQV
jgi:hypothetical protein